MALQVKIFHIRRLSVALLAILLLLTGCGKKKYDPEVVNFDAQYNVEYEKQLYPSLILGLSRIIDDESKIPEQAALFPFRITAPCNKAVLTLVIDSSPLNYTTKIQRILPRKNHRYTIYPAVKWKYDELYNTRHQGTVDLTAHCFINDEEVDVQNIRLNYRSANECLLSLKDTAGNTHDFRWMFTAYVNEEHPYIDSIISTMLDQGVIRRFVGYQTNSDEVMKQVEAIWYYALSRGMTYASISTTSSPAKRANVQHIRFFEEVYKLRQVNCIDACVFFASVMRKLGLKPVIFVIPGHAYLGYYTDRSRKNLKLLETTMSQWVDLPRLEIVYRQTMEDNPKAKGAERLPDEEWQHCRRYLTEAERSRWINGTMTLDQLKRCVSHNLFIQATDYNVKNFNDNIQKFEDRKNLQYQMLDIEKSRKVVQPIGGNW